MNPAVFLLKSIGTAYTSEQRRLLKATLILGCNHSRTALFSGNATPPTKAGSQDRVAHARNPSPWEAEAGASVSLQPAGVIQRDCLK